MTQFDCDRAKTLLLLFKTGQSVGSYAINQEDALSETIKNHWEAVTRCIGNLILAEVANSILSRLFKAVSSLSIEGNSSGITFRRSSQPIATEAQALLTLTGEACTPVVSSLHASTMDSLV